MLRNNEQNLCQALLSVCNILKREREIFKHNIKTSHNILSLIVDVNEASESSDIPIKVLKENTDIFSNFFCNNFNNRFVNIGKKDIEGNYRPVRILPNLLKIFEKYMF